MTYAVIETGGKQYQVSPDSVLKVEKLDSKAGSQVSFDRVLLVSDGKEVKIGKPFVKGAKVQGQVIRQLRDKKLISFKYIRREAGAKTKIGHRQYLTEVKITSIQN